jgi:hypothetical protein
MFKLSVGEERLSKPAQANSSTVTNTLAYYDYACIKFYTIGLWHILIYLRYNRWNILKVFQKFQGEKRFLQKKKLRHFSPYAHQGWGLYFKTFYGSNFCRIKKARPLVTSTLV